MRSTLFGLVILFGMASSAHAQDEQPLNVAEWQSAIEILQYAKAAIVKHGWQQGALSPVESECMATAMERGWSELNKSLVDFDYAKLAVDRAIGAPSLTSLTSADDPLSTPYWGRYYMYWNDAPDRTEAEVLSAFDKAIEIAKEHKQSALKSKRGGDSLQEFDANMMKSLGFIKKQ